MKTKYEVGQEVITNVRVTETVSSIEINSHGTIYRLLSGKVYPEMVLASIENKPTQPIAPQGDKPKYKSGDRVKVVADTNFNQIVGEMVTLKTVFQNTSGSWYWSIAEKCVYISESDIEPYAEPEQPNSPDCAVDNLIYGYQSASLFARELLNRNKLIEPKLTVTRDMLCKLGACSGGLSTFNKLFPSGNGTLKDVCEAAEKCGHADYSSWLTSRKDRIAEMQNEQPKEPEPVYYSGKVVCVDRGGSRCFTQYKGYEFKNGIVIDDDGDEYNSPCKTLHDFNNRSLPQFIPYLGEA